MRPSALLALTLTLFATSAFALDANFIKTGEGIRYKRVIGINIKVYDIVSSVKQAPPSKSKEAMIALDADKKLEWKMLRSVGAEKIRDALREAYEKNNYTDKAKIEALLAPISSELKDGATVTIAYDAASKTTTLSTGGKTASVAGVPFMKATWSIWFGNIDQPSLSEDLLKDLK